MFAESLGSELDPVVLLMDLALEILESDDDSGEGYESQLKYTLDTSGRYFALVIPEGEDYGTEDTHFFEILLTVP